MEVLSSGGPAMAMVVALLVYAAALAAAQNTPADFVAAHNRARALIPVPPVEWDVTVAANAQRYVAIWYAAGCNLVHSSGPYGENLFWGAGKEWTAAEAVQSWADEKYWYNYATSTCAAGRICGHYKQVVWRSSTKIGCARAKCADGVIFITCNYSPPAN